MSAKTVDATCISPPFAVRGHRYLPVESVSDVTRKIDADAVESWPLDMIKTSSLCETKLISEAEIVTPTF